MEINLRKLIASDREAWQGLYHSYLDFYETEPTDEGTAALWKRLFSERPEIEAFVADVGGKVVGFVHYHFQASTWTPSSYCYLEDLFVAQESRGKGVATALIEGVRQAALAKDSTELFWITRAGNATARRLYDRLANETDYVRYEIPLQQG